MRESILHSMFDVRRSAFDVFCIEIKQTPNVELRTSNFERRSACP